ncbi:MAG TPA: P1 family peptidase [Gemmatimonadaceae bacterium]|nr:P1 family peptidase [Gemmatimonadaceae bacterium]
MGDFSALGVAVGHATDVEGATGLTVIRGVDAPFRGGAAVIGRATGTRELQSLAPESLADRVDAILLTGGSAFGLDAASGVMRWMEERGRGFPVPGGVVPIVPAAVIFDLAPLGQFDARPTAEMAYTACESGSSRHVDEGSIGVGTGATVGKVLGPAGAMKGGFGCAVLTHDGLHVGAFAVVNALGDVRDSGGRILAGARDENRRFIDAEQWARSAAPRDSKPRAGHNTTLAVIVTNAALSRLELSQLARAASAGLYRRITPVGTSFDGDLIFALGPIAGGVAAPPLQVEALAVRGLEQSIDRAVRLARGRDGIPGLADGDAS